MSNLSKFRDEQETKDKENRDSIEQLKKEMNDKISSINQINDKEKREA